MKKKKSYKWMVRLIDRITQNDQSNNDSFIYYGHRVNLSSGTRDYVSVDIYDMNYREEIGFSFDFWTEELDFFFYRDYDERDTIIRAFRCFYHGVSVGYDQPWEEERKFYEPMVNDPDYDVADEWAQLMAREAA